MNRPVRGYLWVAKTKGSTSMAAKRKRKGKMVPAKANGRDVPPAWVLAVAVMACVADGAGGLMGWLARACASSARALRLWIAIRLPTPAAPPPRTMERLLHPFRRAFTRPTMEKLAALATGAVLSANRRTVSSALRALGGAGISGFSAFHRVLSCARWSMLPCAGVLLRRIADLFVPAGEPVVIALDDTLERRWGPKIAKKGLYRDACRSSKSILVKTHGLRWLSFQVLVRPAWARRTWGLPFMTLLCPSERWAEKAGRAHRTLIERAIPGARLAARWLAAAGRKAVLVGDGGFGVVELLKALQGKMTVVVRLKLNAVLRGDVPKRKPGRGRAPLLGVRLPSAKELLAEPTAPWTEASVPGWAVRARGAASSAAGGAAKEVAVLLLTGIAAWGDRKGTPIRWVLVRRADGKGEPVLLGCSDPMADPLAIIGWYVKRWAVEVTFAELRRHLGMETQRQWSDAAIERTTPCLFALFSLVALWADGEARRLGRLPVLGATWYDKAHPTFADALAALRRALWKEEAETPILTGWISCGSPGSLPSMGNSLPKGVRPADPLDERLAMLMSWAS